ncbi:MAG: hypothetical protein LBS75_03500 [Synergistaceae bacterium]|jgi:hypothetical protein|nr:hypothetical protein [Synergistaceae bacterium]
MIPLLTCDAIERLLRERFAGVELPSPDGTESSVNIFQMNLPQPRAQTMRPRRHDEDGNEIPPRAEDDAPLEEGGYSRGEARAIFPAIVVRPVKFIGADEADFWGMLTVVLSVGAFDESPECSEGVKRVLNIMERCRQLFEKERILESRYKINLPVQYELYDESVRPFWFGEMITEWRVKALVQELDPRNDFRLESKALIYYDRE